MDEEPKPVSVRAKIIVVMALTALIALVGYFLIGDFLAPNSRGSGTVTITFMVVLPAVLSGFAAAMTDPGDKGVGHYVKTPLGMVGLLLVASLILLREGVICVAMLAPIWLIAGLAGSLSTYFVIRRLEERGKLFSSALLLLPVLAAQVEAQVPVHQADYTVTREIEIDAPPERLWPLLLSIRDIGDDEGQWNVAQDLFAIPRPTDAVLASEGDVSIRRATWGGDVRFEEIIVERAENRLLRWRFAFPDESVREHTDRHIAPDGAHLSIEEGAYRLTALPGGRTRVSLETGFSLRTPLNGYAAWWGNWMLGDIQANILQIIKSRVEAGTT